MKKAKDTPKMKTFDIDPLFEILDYCEELEQKALALFQGDSTARLLARLELEILLTKRGLLK
jgi:hypothetical protein